MFGEKIPAYPEAGSLKVEMWRTVGDYLHQSPQAPVSILTSWRIVMEALQTQEQPLLRGIMDPPSYEEIKILPPKLAIKETEEVKKIPKKIYPDILDLTLNLEAESLSDAKGNLVAEALKTAYEAGELDTEEILSFPVTVGMDVQMNSINEWKPLPLRALKERKAEMILTPSQIVVWDSQYKLQAVQKGTAQITSEQLYGFGQFTTMLGIYGEGQFVFGNLPISPQNLYYHKPP